MSEELMVPGTSNDVAPVQVTDPIELRPLELEHFTIGATGMVVKGAPTFEEWSSIGDLLAMMNHGIQFAIGDWLAWGEGNYGEKADQIVDAGRFSEQSCSNFRWVSKNVPMENRTHIGKPLHWTHYQAVASLPADQQKGWLDKAAGSNDNGVVWSVSQLKQEVTASAASSRVCYLLVVECTDEVHRERMASRLESDGLPVKRTEIVRKTAAKAGPVTARKRRS